MKTSVKIPQAPKHLKQHGTAFWKTVCTEFALPQDMLATLETACQALDRAEEARQAIATDGLFVFDRFNQQKAHPAIIIERDAKSLFLRAVKQLGIGEVPDSELLKLAKARR